MPRAQTLEIRKGEKTRVIRRFCNSLPMTFQFRAEPVSGSDNLSGIVQIDGSSWIFSKDPVEQALKVENSVSKTIWDTFYSVYVIPDCDVRITLEQSRFTGVFPILILAILITAVAFVIMMATLRM